MSYALVGLVLTACSFNSKEDRKVIVIAVEGLGVHQVNCVNEPQDHPRSGFSIFCQESIRFTHAFTPSLNSGAALGSILTGRLPLETGYRGQSHSFLPSHEQTISEKLFERNIKTSFFSGGVPIFRKTNLHQGFELFDDFFKPSVGRMYRPFSHLIPLFQNWYSDKKPKSFLSFFYLSDLLFPDVQSFDDLGKTRELSFSSQLEEVDESLFQLIQFLKQEKIWDSTTIFLVGLNGPATMGRPSELMNTNLYSERTQVTLLIKPSQKPRDEGISWSINDNINLTDVGMTLFDIFQVPHSGSKYSESLKPFLTSSNMRFRPDRIVVSESAWHEMDRPRVALRTGPFLVIYDLKWKIYNTFVDRTETSPMSLGDHSLDEYRHIFDSFIYENDLTPWTDLDIEDQIQWKAISEIFSHEISSENRKQGLQKAAHRLVENPKLQSLYAKELIQQSSWDDLKRWGQGTKKIDLELLALINEGKSPHRNFESACLKALSALERFGEVSRKCDEKIPYLFLEWMQTELKPSSSELRDQAKNRFIRQLAIHEIDRKLLNFNWRYQSAFEISSGTIEQDLTLEMMLSFPKTKKFRTQIAKEIQSIHEAL